MDNPQGNTVSEVPMFTPGQTFFLPLTLKPLDDPKFDPGESIVVDAETGHISTISNREFAEVAIRAVNAHDDLLEACKHALTIAHEYDESGFAGTIVLKKMLVAAIAKATGPTDTHRDSVNEQWAGREDS